MSRPTPRAFIRAALTPRMLALFVLLAVAAVVCVRLGSWQLDRASERAQQLADAEAAALARAEPTELLSVLTPQSTFTGAAENRRVVTRGTYDADGQLLVADRHYEGVAGYGVVAPLWVEVESGRRAVLPVLRGWVADPTHVPPPPRGEVEVIGLLRPSEAIDTADAPPGQLAGISAAELLNRWGGPIWTGYLLLESSDPPEAGPQAGGLTPLPRPAELPAGLNIQNLAYAIQWWIFGGFAALIWFRAVRDDARGVSRGPHPPPSPTADRPTPDRQLTRSDS